MKTWKLDGKPFDLRPPAPPSVQTVKKLLESLKPDELLTSDEVVKRTNLNPSTLEKYAAPHLSAYYHRCLGHRRYWGSPQAIQELKRQLGEK